MQSSQSCCHPRGSENQGVRRWVIGLDCGQDVRGWADPNSVQEERSSHTDLLERVLQLRPLHCLPWSHNFGLAMSDKLDPQPDYMGIFLPAVLPADWQLHRRRFQKDVSRYVGCFLINSALFGCIKNLTYRHLCLSSFLKGCSVPCLLCLSLLSSSL